MATIPESHYELGNLLRMQGRLEEAIASYRRALQLRPDDFRSLNNLGLALKDQGNVEEAIACFRQVLQLRPDDAAPYNNLGIALRDQGRTDEASLATARPSNGPLTVPCPTIIWARPCRTREDGTKRSPAAAGPWN